MSIEIGCSALCLSNSYVLCDVGEDGEDDVEQLERQPADDEHDYHDHQHLQHLGVAQGEQV